MSFPVFWLQLHCSEVLLDGLAVHLLVHVNAAEIIVDSGEFEVDLDCFAGHHLGLFEFLPQEMSGPQSGEGFSQSRIDVQGLTALHDSFFHFAFFQVGITKVGIGFGVMGVEFDGFLV